MPGKHKEEMAPSKRASTGGVHQCCGKEASMAATSGDGQPPMPSASAAASLQHCVTLCYKAFMNSESQQCIGCFIRSCLGAAFCLNEVA